MKISVIIPTYNEIQNIYGVLEELFTNQDPDEVIVVDGGSTDQTVNVASEWTQVLKCQKGRARQLNYGASQATGDVLLFLHADTVLPANGIAMIKATIARGHLAGRFRLCFDDSRWLLRFYASYTRFQFFSYGDQGFFITRNLFHQMMGFRGDVPFEDIEFYKRLLKVTRPVILKDPVVTSARRFTGVGCLKQKFINLFLVTLYYLGLDVFRYKEKLYKDVR